jgi:hypothetical protein
MKLLMALPTRGRPQLLLQTLATMVKGAVLPETEIVVQADADDKETIACNAWLDMRVTFDVRPREDTIAGKINRAMSIPADAYMIGADDDPPVTHGWDALMLKVASVFPDGIGMVYGRMANASFPGKYAMTAKLMELLGYIQPEYFPYWFVDHWTDDVVKMIGRISFADVQSDQSRAGKTQEMREPGWWATWFDAAYLMRRKQALAIIDNPDFQSPDWLKEILRGHAPLIEYRSRWINDNVRAQDRQLSAWSGLSTADERYQRVRRKAVDMVPHLLGDFGMDAREAETFRAILTPPTSVVGLKRAYG